MDLLKRIGKRKWVIKSFINMNFSEKRSLFKGFFKRKDFFPKKKTKANIKKLIYCMLCPNMCRFDCPPLQTSKRETHSPAVKARIGYFLEMNRLDKTEENITPLFEGCLHCSACQIFCPFDFAVGELLEGVAADLYIEQCLPQKIKEFSARIENFNGLYPETKYHYSKDLLKEMNQGEIYYFPGCVTIGNHPKVIEDMKILAKKANIKMITDLDVKLCCGAPSLYIGNQTLCKQLAKQNIAHFKSVKAKAIVCECPECAHMLSYGYKQLGFKLDIPVFHISEWIVKLVEDNKIKIITNQEKNGKLSSLFPLSFHDPCVLARKMNKSQYPNKLLQKAFGSDFKRINASEKLTHCCGFGGMVYITNPSLANEIAKKRLKEFSKEGIQTIVTSCPTCRYGLMKNNNDLEFEIMDLLEIIIEVIE